MTVADRIRPVKVAIIFALGRWLKMDSITVQRTCAQIYLCRPSDLSQDAGEEFIAYLKTLRPEAVN